MNKQAYQEERKKLIAQLRAVGATKAATRWPVIRESKYGFVDGEKDEWRWTSQIIEMRENLRDIKLTNAQ